MKYSEEQGVSPDNSARLLMFYGLSSCIARLVAGRVCDVTWVNPQYVFQVGNFIAALSIIFAPLAGSYVHFLVCGLFFGVGAGISIATSNLIFLTCVDERRRASAFGLASCLASFSILSSPPLAGKFILVNYSSKHFPTPVSTVSPKLKKVMGNLVPRLSFLCLWERGCLTGLICCENLNQTNSAVFT